MKKTVYLVEEQNLNGDSFESCFTFSLAEAKESLASEAKWGYEKEKKNPQKTTYWLLGYEIDTDLIDEDELSDTRWESIDKIINDPKALYDAWDLYGGMVSLPNPVEAIKYEIKE